MAKNGAKQAVIFDFDGVVADSWQLHERCWREVLKAHGLKIPEEALAKSIGLSSADTADLIVKELGADIDAKELGEAKGRRFVELAAKELQPMSGAREALRRMQADFPVAVSAIRRKAGVQRFLDHFDMAGNVDELVTMDDLSDTRDINELFEVTAKRLEVTPERCVVVEDARNGILAAKRADMAVIAFNSNPKHEIDFSMADAEITSLDELVPELINSADAV